MRRGRAITTLLLALCALLPTCAAPTEITVQVYSEVTCDRHAQVGLVGGRQLAELGDKAPAATSSNCNMGGEPQRVGTIVLQPAGANDDEIAFQLVTRDDDRGPETCTAATGYAGCIIAKRQLHFTPHHNTPLRVDLRISCLDLPCDVDKTCVNHRCVPAQVPADCSPPCDESALGGAQGPSPSQDAAADVPDASPVDAGSLVDGSADALIGSASIDYQGGSFITQVPVPVSGVSPGGTVVVCALVSSLQKAPITSMDVSVSDTANDSYSFAGLSSDGAKDALFMFFTNTSALTNGTITVSFPAGAKDAMSLALAFPTSYANSSYIPNSFNNASNPATTFGAGTIGTDSGSSLVVACGGAEFAPKSVGSMAWSSGLTGSLVMGPSLSYDFAGAEYAFPALAGSYTAGGTLGGPGAESWMTILASFY
jgi:hypothetical protein